MSRRTAAVARPPSRHAGGAPPLVSVTGVRTLATRHPVAAYAILAFGLTWAWWVPMALRGDVVAAGWRPSHFPGLLGPMVAALAVTGLVEGRAGPRCPLSAMGRWRIGARGWLLATSPLLACLVLIAAAALAGDPVAATAFGRFDGLPAVGPVGVTALLILVNGFGEETGWRGFLLPRLAAGRPATAAALLVGVIWALWHLPIFWVVSSFRGIGPGMVAGFAVGILAGAVVLAALHDATGGSVLAVAVWHGLYNLVVASDAGGALVQAVVSTGVMVVAVGIVAVRWHRRRR